MEKSIKKSFGQTTGVVTLKFSDEANSRLNLNEVRSREIRNELWLMVKLGNDFLVAKTLRIGVRRTFQK